MKNRDFIDGLIAGSAIGTMLFMGVTARNMELIAKEAEKARHALEFITEMQVQTGQIKCIDRKKITYNKDLGWGCW